MNENTPSSSDQVAQKIIRKPSQTDEAVDLIRSKIIDLTLPQGSRIDERMLVEQFKLGRTPAREAINRLQAEGLVTIIPDRGGKFVRDLDLQEVGEIMMAHQVAETMLASLCNFSSARLLADLQRIQDAYEEAVKARNYLLITELNERFHLRLYETINNSFLMDFAQSTHRHVRRLLVMMYKLEAGMPSVHDEQFDANIEQHRAIIHSVKMEDQDALKGQLPNHALQTQFRLSAFYESNSGRATGVDFSGLNREN